MPTAFVAPKPVPSTVTDEVGAWAVGVDVIAPAALAFGMAARTIESVRKAIIDVVYNFFLRCIFFIPLISLTMGIACTCI